jgi:hypothetical protein
MSLLSAVHFSNNLRQDEQFGKEQTLDVLGVNAKQNH